MRAAALLLALLALTACTVLTPSPPVVADPDREPAEGVEAPVPAGEVTVAYPHPVGAWWQADVEDLGAGDLAGLWGLPLYRHDADGRPVPGLATTARVLGEQERGWTVEVDLATGTWSDGAPVGSDDVVATAIALAAARPAAWAAFRDAEVVDDDTVRLLFDRPYLGWAALLSEAPGVLPAHVLESGGLDAFVEDLPVTGGWFSLASATPGLSATFEAHEGSPLGPPGLAAVDVLVVPAFEAALGMLADGRVDAATGYVVLDPSARWGDVDELVGVTTFGGSRFELVWRDGGGTRDQRVAAAGRLDPLPFVEGLLRDVGRAPGGLLPSLERLPRPVPMRAEGTVAVQVTRTDEGIGLLARRLQADLRDAGADATLVRVDPPEHLEDLLPVDARLRTVRVGPGRSAAALLEEVGLPVAPGVAADAAGWAPTDAMARDRQPRAALQPLVDLLADDPRLVPLAEIAVTHVWHPDRVDRLDPSGWPGVAFWDVGGWVVPGG